MKRLLITAFVFLFIFVLCSCNSHYGQINEPIRTEVNDYDLPQAKSIIEPGDKLIADISTKESVTRQEFEQFLSDVKTAYGDNIPWSLMFFYNSEFEDNSVDILHLNKNMFFPTIYHEDIDIVSAKVEKSYYEDKTLDRTTLIIKIEYTGEDSKLKGWNREYRYIKTDSNTWAFDTFAGVGVNLLGDDFKPDYLRLKQ